MTAGPTVEDAHFPLRRISNTALLAAIVFAFLALRRFATFHNETFDLAFYARLVWGLGHGDQYQPLTNSFLWGLHASPILFVLARLGRLFAIVPMLLVLQAASVAAAGIPLARIAARRVGHSAAADVAIIGYLLYPTVASIATYEFHPSALALLPLALALDFFDSRKIWQGCLALVVAALCREDVALVAAVTGLALAVPRGHRLVGFAVFACGLVYFVAYFFFVAPKYLPRHGSIGLHFGYLGDSPGALLRTIVHHPVATARAVLTPSKLLYAPRLLVPVAFLSLLAPRWLLPAIVPFGINLLSRFPTAIQVPSHYTALIVPFVFASAAHGAARLAAARPGAINRYVVVAGLAFAAGTLMMQHRAGATPLSRRWNARAFQRDSRSDEIERLLAHVPHDGSIVAPDYVLPHVAERAMIQRVPWNRASDWVLLSLEYRSRFGSTQELWRSSEEVLLRNTLSGDEYAVYALEGDHVLLRRGWPVRAFAYERYVDCAPEPGLNPQHVAIGPSLTLAAWGTRAAGNGSVVVVRMRAEAHWPADLGFEIGYGPLHRNGDRDDPARIVSVPAFDGLFSPVHVRVGEMVRQEVVLPASITEIRRSSLYLGARRIDGSRLDPASPHWILLR